MGTALTDGLGVIFTVNDGGDTITGAVDPETLIEGLNGSPSGAVGPLVLSVDDTGNWAIGPLPLTVLADVTPSATDLNYVDGVTSAIQTQIDGKQPLDADLIAIAGWTYNSANLLQANLSAW